MCFWRFARIDPTTFESRNTNRKGCTLETPGAGETGGQTLVRTLKRLGVDHIFGLPGDTGMAFYDALYDEPGIKHIMSRDERSASFMADVYARVSRRLGVCEGPSGGGATYIVPGVAEAQGSAIPLLCLTSDTASREQHRNVLTELDQPGLFAPVTKWTERVHHAGSMEDAVIRAVRLALSDRPGATHLSLPSDALEDRHDTPPRVVSEAHSDHVPTARARPDSNEVERAARLIEQAQSAVVIAGGGVLTSGAWDDLTAFADATGIPVATSINGKGSIAETHPASIGVIGNNGARSYANAWVAEADLLIFLGTRTDSTTTWFWTLPPKATPPLSIHIDVSAREIGNTYPSGAFLLGDAAATLRDLTAAFAHPDRLRQVNQPRLQRLAMEREAYFSRIRQEAASDAQPIKPQRLISTLRDLLDDDTVIVADPGTPTPYLAAQYELRRPGRTTVIPRAHGGLGYAIPGVVGAWHAVAHEGRRVVGMTGDGSFGFSVGELETISRLNLPIVLIQCSNNTFGWIKELQHLYHDRRYYSVDFNGVDYAKIAEGFGLAGVSVTDPADLRKTLQNALASGKPTFVSVVTEPQMTETPPVASWERTVAATANR
jgi:acetolactate synthase I/II/III large subunit